MKLSCSVPVLMVALPAVVCGGTSVSHSRGLLENTTRLSNGAHLGVEILSPVLDWNVTLGPKEASTSVTFKGTANVGKGTPDVAYIYVIDSSGSTTAYDGACGSTLECVQDFFLELTDQTVRTKSAKSIAVIDFDDHGWVRADWSDPSSVDIANGIQLLSSDGGTACSHALEMTTLMVHQQKVAGTTVVIFAGDGECNGGDNSAITVSENVTDAADLLGDTGAIVHSLAIGDMVNCSIYNDLNEIPRNGGMCFSIPAPSDLDMIIDDIVGTVLVDVEVKVDGGKYKSLTPVETGGTTLPRDGTVEVDFATTIDLAEGSHEICIRATGSGFDKMNQIAEAEDCHTVEILPAPSASPSSVPSFSPSATPSSSPTSTPSQSPSMAPTSAPPAVGPMGIGLLVAVCVFVLAFAAAICKIRSLAPGATNTKPRPAKDFDSQVSADEISFEDEPEVHQGVPIGRINQI